MEIGEIKQLMREDLNAGKLNPLQESLFEDRPAEFLYDIVNDPWETKNLAEDTASQVLLEEMRAQSIKNLDPYKSQILKAMRDAYPPVQITASAIAYDVFKDSEAEENLKKYALNNNKDLALMAINYLLYVEDPGPFVGTIQEVYGMDDRHNAVLAASKDFLGSLGLVPNTFKYR